MTTIEKEFVYRGHPYKVFCQADQSHPSHWSHIDEDVVRQRWWDIQPNEVVLDVGTAYGSYALTALACGASHVFGWSPQGHPGDQMKEADYLRRSLKLNGWSDRLTLWPKSGCYSERGWYETTTTKFTKEKPEPTPEWTIFVEPIDRMGFVFGEYGRITTMKLDVEGAEVHVLHGAERTVKDNRPRILVEHHNFLVPDVEAQVWNLLEGWGYKHAGNVKHGSVSHGLYLP